MSGLRESHERGLHLAAKSCSIYHLIAFNNAGVRPYASLPPPCFLNKKIKKARGNSWKKSIMPQLDKFTYFTQFFWLCLFFFTYSSEKLLRSIESAHININLIFIFLQILLFLILRKVVNGNFDELVNALAPFLPGGNRVGDQVLCLRLLLATPRISKWGGARNDARSGTTRARGPLWDTPRKTTTGCHMGQPRAQGGAPKKLRWTRTGKRFNREKGFYLYRA